MTVEWSDYARGRLREIIQEIANERGCAVARKWKARLEASTSLLASLPQIGGEVREIGREDIREIGIPPYRVIYRVMPNRCIVVDVLHSRQSLPSDSF